MKIAISFFLLTLAALAGDIDGKWTAEAAGRDGQPQQLTFTFKAEGARLTGTIANSRGSLDITEGTISGNNVSFKIVFGEVTIVHTGKLSGNEIQFERKREGGEQTQKFVAKKQS